MHISEGILSIPVLLGSTTLAVAGIAIGLRQLDNDRIPMTALLAAVFFLASLVHLPVGVGSVHLVANGLCGLLLGWIAFPAIVVSLILQMVFFGFGGLTTLGINTLVMALPAVICHYLFGRNLINYTAQRAFWQGCMAGGFAIILGVFLLSSALYLTGGEAFNKMIILIFIAHIPIILVEGLLTGFIISFVYQVEPALLQSYFTE